MKNEVLNEKMNDIMKMAESLETFNLLMKGHSEAIINEAKKVRYVLVY